MRLASVSSLLVCCSCSSSEKARSLSCPCWVCPCQIPGRGSLGDEAPVRRGCLKCLKYTTALPTTCFLAEPNLLERSWLPLLAAHLKSIFGDLVASPRKFPTDVFYTSIAGNPALSHSHPLPRLRESSSLPK